MSELLLDTCVVSELRKAASSRADRRFVAWARRHSAAQAISAITLFELEIGVRRSERRDEAQGRVLRAWLSTVSRTFEGSILPVDARIAALAAGWHVPDTAPERDAFIAATAAVHRLTVATRNTADFKRFGVPLVNPWDADSGREAD